MVSSPDHPLRLTVEHGSLPGEELVCPQAPAGGAYLAKRVAPHLARHLAVGA